MHDHTISPGTGNRPDGSPYPFVVRCTQTGIMGGYETKEAAESARAMWQNQPRKASKFDFVVERNPAAK